MLQNPIWNIRIMAARQRLREPDQWFPFSIFIAVGLVLFLTAHILSGTNPRAGHPADVMTLPTIPGKDSAIWLSVAPIDGNIVVTTADRQIFRWPLGSVNVSDIDPITKHLKNIIAGEISSAALAKKALKSQILAIIAADQRLAYFHVRPLISALAQAGVSHYAFETLNPHSVAR